MRLVVQNVVSSISISEFLNGPIRALGNADRYQGDSSTARKSLACFLARSPEKLTQMRRVMPEDEGRKADRGRNRFLRPGIVALCRCSGWCSKNLKARIMASRLGPACPRAIGCKGAAGAFIRL